MYATGYVAIGQGYLLLMGGTLVYLYMRWQRSKERVAIRTEHLETLPEAPVADTTTARPPVGTAT